MISITFILFAFVKRMNIKWIMIFFLQVEIQLSQNYGFTEEFDQRKIILERRQFWQKNAGKKLNNYEKKFNDWPFGAEIQTVVYN
jgi:hypothetical protein